MDEILISFTKFLVEKFDTVEEVIFHHNIHYNFSDEVKDLINDLPKPLPEFLKDKIQKKLSDNFNDVLPYDIIISENNDTANALVEVGDDKNCDLILMGKKSSFAGSGYLIERIIHQNIKTPLWVVPEKSSHKIDDILVPVDFKSTSAVMIQKLIAMDNSLNLNPTFLHVFEIPRVFFPYVPQEDHYDKIKEETHHKWEHFTQKHFKNQNLEYPFNAVFHAENSIAQTIYQEAIKNNIDLILLHLPIGTTNNKVFQLLRLDMQIPILILP